MPSSRPDILKPSSYDLICLGEAVQNNFHGLAKLYLRVQRTPMVVPGSMRSAVERVARLRERHSKGHLMHTDSERRALEDLAQWTLDLNLRTRGQKPRRLNWNWLKD